MCNNCIHEDVCIYKDRYRDIYKKINGTFDKENNPIGTLDFIPKPINLDCRFFTLISARRKLNEC